MDYGLRTVDYGLWTIDCFLGEPGGYSHRYLLFLNDLDKPKKGYDVVLYDVVFNTELMATYQPRRHF